MVSCLVGMYPKSHFSDSTTVYVIWTNLAKQNLDTRSKEEFCKRNFLNSRKLR